MMYCVMQSRPTPILRPASNCARVLLSTCMKAAAYHLSECMCQMCPQRCRSLDGSMHESTTIGLTSTAAPWMSLSLCFASHSLARHHPTAAIHIGTSASPMWNLPPSICTSTRYAGTSVKTELLTANAPAKANNHECAWRAYRQTEESGTTPNLSLSGSAPRKTKQAPRLKSRPPRR